MSLLLQVGCRDTSRLASRPVTGTHRIMVIHQPGTVPRPRPRSPDSRDAVSPARPRPWGHGLGTRPVYGPGRRASRRHGAVRVPGDDATAEGHAHGAYRLAGPVRTVRCARRTGGPRP